MQDLYKRVTLLIGKSFDDAMIARLADELDETPEVIVTAGLVHDYFFWKHGISIHCNEALVPRRWLQVAFYLSGSHGNSGFAGKLPFGLSATDTRLEVQRKLKMTPVPIHRIPYYRRNRPDNESLEIRLPPFDATCSFLNDEPYTLSTVFVSMLQNEVFDSVNELYG